MKPTPNSDYGDAKRPLQPEALPGFSHINRYWDPVNRCYVAKLIPGEYYVTREEEMIATVLGSCIAVCIRDIVTRVGGMNHFMLPRKKILDGDDINMGNSTRYGASAMDNLIQDILRYGGKRENLEIKVFGGGKILDQNTDIGKMNIHFIHEYLEQEGLHMTSHDMGGIYPRKVHYYPDTGRARMKKLRTLHNNTVIDREEKYISSLKKK